MDGEAFFELWKLFHLLLMAVLCFGTGTVNLVLGNESGRKYLHAVSRFATEVIAAELFTALLGFAARKRVPFGDSPVRAEVAFIVMAFCIFLVVRRSQILIDLYRLSDNATRAVEQENPEPGSHPEP